MNEPFDRPLFSLVHDVARLIRIEADKRARVHGMTRAGWSLIASLAHNPGLSQKELADRLEVEPISVARIVDRLEAVGLLERRADASDRRIWRLHLLPAAEPVLEQLSVMSDELGSFVAQGVSPSVRDAMVEGLMQMKMNLTQKTEPQNPGESTDTAAVREAV